MKLQELEQLSDTQLRDMIVSAQTLLGQRSEERKQNAISEIRRVAAEAGIQVSIGHTKQTKNARPTLKAGMRYEHPTDPTRFYVTGKGRPPEWFEEMRRTGQLQEAIR